MRRMLLLIVLISCGALLAAASASAAATQPRPAPVIGFDANASTPQGDIVVVGTAGYFFRDSTEPCQYSVRRNCVAARPLVARFRPDGSLDPAFGGGSGYVLLSPEYSSYLTPGYLRTADIAVASDGGVVAYIALSNGTSKIVRLDSTGTPDGSFGVDGVVQVPTSVQVAFAADILAVDSSGRVLLTGTDFSQGNGVVLRLTRSGAPDPSFGSNGLVSLPTARGEALALRPDGRVLVAGGGAASQLDASGAIDTGFGDQGVTTIPVQSPGTPPFQSFHNVAHAIALDASGRAFILLERDPDTPDLHFRCGDSTVVLLGAEGTVDTGFGNEGLAPPSRSTCARDLALTESGGLFSLSAAIDYSPSSSLVEIGYAGSGGIDPTFVPPASLIRVVGRSTDAGSVAELSDGTVVVAGGAHGVGFLLAQRPDGEVVSSFGTHGLTTLPATRICATPFEFCGYPSRDEFRRLAREVVGRSVETTRRNVRLRFACSRAIGEGCDVKGELTLPGSHYRVADIEAFTMAPHIRLKVTTKLRRDALEEVAAASHLDVRATISAAHQRPVHLTRRVRVRPFPHTVTP